MTDAPFTETHRITLDVMAASTDTLPHESAAITAALREMTDLHALLTTLEDRVFHAEGEVERLTTSLKDVRDRKNERINDLLQHLSGVTTECDVQSARAREAEDRLTALMLQHAEVIVEAAQRLALRQEEIDRLAALVQNLRTQLGNLHNILKAEQA